MRRIAELVAVAFAMVCFSCAGGEDPFVFGENSGAGGAEQDGSSNGGADSGGSGGMAGGEENTGGIDPGVGGWESETGGTGGYGYPGGSGGGPGGSNCFPPVSGPCNTFPQCGCNPGQSCDVWKLDGSTDCFDSWYVPVSAACNALGACVPGASCVANTCKYFCKYDSDCPRGDGNGARCFAPASETGQTVPQYRVCTDHCQPWVATSCTGGLGCGTKPEFGVVAFARPGTFSCSPAGTSTAYCTKEILCAPGYACMTDNKCRRWCRVGMNDCGGSAQCVSIGDTAIQGLYWEFTEIGVCDP